MNLDATMPDQRVISPAFAGATPGLCGVAPAPVPASEDALNDTGPGSDLSAEASWKTQDSDTVTGVASLSANNKLQLAGSNPAALTSDRDLYEYHQEQMKKAWAAGDQSGFQSAWKASEQIKNRHGGMPPQKES